MDRERPYAVPDMRSSKFLNFQIAIPTVQFDELHMDLPCLLGDENNMRANMSYGCGSENRVPYFIISKFLRPCVWVCREVLNRAQCDLWYDYVKPELQRSATPQPNMTLVLVNASTLRLQRDDTPAIYMDFVWVFDIDYRKDGEREVHVPRSMENERSALVDGMRRLLEILK
jgi:hypothetical protein